jgi:hypothetical protein
MRRPPDSPTVVEGVAAMEVATTLWFGLWWTVAGVPDHADHSGR